MPMADSMRRIKRSRERGAKLIAVDLVRTETARQADLFLQVLPGEDAVLFAAMIRVILEQGWKDREFCAGSSRRWRGFATQPKPSRSISRRLGRALTPL
jgi:anaerobic selenocysteine-containing dehydrogenase